MKKLIFILLLSFIGIYMNAQEHLLPVDKKAKETFYDKEIKRLLIPDDTEFGMICKPSFEFESSLTYDSEARALVYIEADTSIYLRTFRASHYLEQISEREFMWKSREITSYNAPGTRMYVLPSSAEMVQSLKRLWKVAAIGQDKPIEPLTFNGNAWEYFIGKKRGKIEVNEKGGKGKVRSLINLTIELRNAVRENDSQKCAALQSQIDSLYKEFK